MNAFFNALSNLLFVPKCAGCGERMDFRTKAILCRDCQEAFLQAKASLCPDCGKPTESCPCAGKILPGERVLSVEKLVPYYSGEPEMVTNRILFRLKHQADQPLLTFLAEELALRLSSLLPADRESVIVTYAPRSVKARRRDGHDHMRLLSMALADALELRFDTLLLRKSGKEQKGMSGRERAKNMKTAYAPAKNRELRGKTVILLDDILTTGNTLAAAVRVLRGMGARNFIVATLAMTQTRI